jgi:hypothetical protein
VIPDWDRMRYVFSNLKPARIGENLPLSRP